MRAANQLPRIEPSISPSRSHTRFLVSRVSIAPRGSGDTRLFIVRFHSAIALSIQIHHGLAEYRTPRGRRAGNSARGVVVDRAFQDTKDGNKSLTASRGHAARSLSDKIGALIGHSMPIVGSFHWIRSSSSGS